MSAHINKLAALVVSTYDDKHLSAVALDRAMSDLRAALSAQAAAPVDERAAFEKAARTQGYNLVRNDKSRDDYAFPAASGAWFAWQARSALAHPVAVDAPSEDAIEGLEILDSLIDSIEEHGNYSKEATLTFLRQIKQCFPNVAAIAAQDKEQ